MKKEKKWIIYTLFIFIYNLNAQQLAFPGAEGFGKYTKGGRGGMVLEVTNLNDNGAGSLRDALTSSSYKGKKRTIVFKVSGTIELQSTIEIKYDSCITIAGQTAPGDGICIKNFPIKIGDSRDIIIRYVRFRIGDQQDCGTGCDEIDAHSYRKCHHIVLDHCSLSWSIDAILDLTVQTGYSSVQWCLLHEPLNNSKHSKGAHSYIAGWDGNSYGGGSVFGGGSYHHNLLVSGGSRTPRLDSYAGENGERDLIDIVNNVIYNWSGNGAYGGEHADVNWQNNYYRYGPSTSKKSQIFQPDDSCKMYVNGNYVDGYPDVTADNSLGISASALLTLNQILQNVPYTVWTIGIQTPENAYNSVLAHSGAFIPRRDICDLRIVNDVINRTGKIIDSQSEVGGWPVLNSTTAPLDTDHDGMPDSWETFKGLALNNAADRNTISADGYTMLEKYLNSIEFNYPVQNVILTRKPGQQIIVRWSDTYMSEDGFIIERSVNGGPFTQLAEVGKNVTLVSDSAINETDQYTYRVKVKTSELETGYSDSLSSATLPKEVTYKFPAQNAELLNDTLTFTWNTSEGAVSYSLYAGNEETSLNKINSLTTTEYKYKLPLKDTVYYWRVDAVNENGTTEGEVWGFNCKVTGIAEVLKNSSGISLFPNPSSNEITINWSCSGHSNISIEILDIGGRKVKRLLQNNSIPGNYFITWNGMTDEGKSVSPGIYFCRVTINDEQSVLRINRIK